jgi:FkbM family methyltransferase
MYAGAYEVAVVHRLRRLVRSGSVFLDVGANVGYLSAVAADAAGPEGEVHAFEPVPRYFRALERLAELNPSRRIHAHALAVGEAPGVARIGVSRGSNTGWNTMVPGAADADSETVDAPVTTLDDHVRAHGLAGRDLVVKIDAEGYEFPVLRGFARTLAEASPAPRLVCEVSPDAYPRLGTSLAALAAFLAELGYRAYGVETLRPLDVARLERITDVVLLRGSA